MRTIKEFEHGDGAHCGLSDWYPEKEKALLRALKSGKPFDTGWYASKKEIASARVFTKEDGPIPGIYVEVSVSDDFDTVGTAGALVTSRTLAAVREAISDAWDDALKDKENNEEYVGFSIHARRTHYAVYIGGKPQGKPRRCLSWVETYILDKSGHGIGHPPGDNYHKWGWQGDARIPAKIKAHITTYIEENWPTIKRPKRFGAFTVRKWE